jgi:hypothetical protein
MPLRKKHVRWILAGLLMAAVLAPLTALVLYGFRMSGDAMGRDLAAQLESRLRASAQVTGVRPTGPFSATADRVELTWTAAGGRLVLVLEDLKAEHSVYGWAVRAARGRLTLDGPSPVETLAALNQRLLQPPASADLASLAIERLQMRLDTGGRILRTDVKAVARPSMTVYTVSLYRPRGGKASAHDAADESAGRAMATLRLDAASAQGLLDSLRVDAKGLPLGRSPPMSSAANKGDVDIAATLDLAADWSRPACTARATFHELDLAAWTKNAPGGPLTGAAALTLAYDRKARGPEELRVDLESSGGSVTPAFLGWAETLPASLRAGKPAGPAAMEFDRLAVRCRIVGNRGWFEGPTDPAGGVPLATSRLLGIDLPLLRAPSHPFDAREVWPPLAKALGLEDEPEGSAGKK